jgi:hypothetical protein
VEFHIEGFRTQYVYLHRGIGYRHSGCHSVKTLGGSEQDGLSLEEFKAVVKN